MKKLFLTSIAALFLATGAAQPAEVEKDVLTVVLKDDNGKTSLHYQLSQDCQKFLSLFRQLRNQGIAVRLKFFDPEANGEVLKAYCIHPDGSIEHGGEDMKS
jgi:hypothetical protein